MGGIRAGPVEVYGGWRMVHVWEQGQARAGVGCGGGAGVCTCLQAISRLPEHRWLVIWVHAVGSARGRTQKRAVVGRQEASSVSSRNSSFARDPSLPTHHRSADPEAAFPAAGAGGPAVRQLVLRVFEVFRSSGLSSGSQAEGELRQRGGLKRKSTRRRRGRREETRREGSEQRAEKC